MRFTLTVLTAFILVIATLFSFQPAVAQHPTLELPRRDSTDLFIGIGFNHNDYDVSTQGSYSSVFRSDEQLRDAALLVPRHELTGTQIDYDFVRIRNFSQFSSQHHARLKSKGSIKLISASMKVNFDRFEKRVSDQLSLSFNVTAKSSRTTLKNIKGTAPEKVFNDEVLTLLKQFEAAKKGEGDKTIEDLRTEFRTKYGTGYIRSIVYGGQFTSEFDERVNSKEEREAIEMKLGAKFGFIFSASAEARKIADQISIDEYLRHHGQFAGSERICEPNFEAMMEFINGVQGNENRQAWIKRMRINKSETPLASVFVPYASIPTLSGIAPLPEGLHEASYLKYTKYRPRTKRFRDDFQIQLDSYAFVTEPVASDTIAFRPIPVPTPTQNPGITVGSSGNAILSIPFSVDDAATKEESNVEAAFQEEHLKDVWDEFPKRTLLMSPTGIQLRVELDYRPIPDKENPDKFHDWPEEYRLTPLVNQTSMISYLTQHVLGEESHKPFLCKFKGSEKAAEETLKGIQDGNIEYRTIVVLNDLAEISLPSLKFELANNGVRMEFKSTFHFRDDETSRAFRELDTRLRKFESERVQWGTFRFNPNGDHKRNDLTVPVKFNQPFSSDRVNVFVHATGIDMVCSHADHVRFACRALDVNKDGFRLNANTRTNAGVGDPVGHGFAHVVGYWIAIENPTISYSGHFQWDHPGNITWIKPNGVKADHTGNPIDDQN